MSNPADFRIIVINDQPEIHDDFRKILLAPESLETGETGELLGQLAEHSGNSHELVLPNYEIETVCQGQAGVQLVASAFQDANCFSLAIVDLRMPPGMDGIETIRKLWEIDPGLQVILCMAGNDRTWAGTLLQLGASDRWLILKEPFDPVEVRQAVLALCVKYELQRIAESRANELRRMVAERSCELEVEIARRQQVEDLLLSQRPNLGLQSSTDPTTGLQQNQAIRERVENLGQRAAEIGVPFSVLMIDIDFLTETASQHGQFAKAAILEKVAKRLKSMLRPLDAIGRFGESGFLIGLIECNADDASIIGERLICAVEESPVEFAEKEISVTICVGVASGLPGATSDAQLVREQAEAALLTAREAGKGQIESIQVACSSRQDGGTAIPFILPDSNGHENRQHTH